VQPERVVLGEHVRGVRDERRMRSRDVVGLHERFDGRLPVAVDDHPEVPGLPHLAPRKLLEVPRYDVAEEIAQRLGIGIEVHEDPPVPRLRPDREETVFGVGHLREVPSTRDVLQRTVEVVTPRMEGAVELRCVPAAARNRRAAVAARIVERTDRVGCVADDDHRTVDDLVLDEVSDLGNVVLPARHLPDARPESRRLAIEELTGDVVRSVDLVGRGGDLIPALEEQVGHRERVALQELDVVGDRVRVVGVDRCSDRRWLSHTCSSRES